MNEQDQLLYDRMLRSFTNITPTAEQIERIEQLRDIYKDAMFRVITFADNGRERSLALTNLETSLMYAVKAILMSETK